MTEPLRITVPLRVRYGECDAQGIAFNAHYVAWFDLANTELWRTAIGGYAKLEEHGVETVLAEMTVRYRAPARFDEELELETWIASFGTTSMVAACVARRGDTVLAEGDLRYVFVDADTWEKTPAPAELRRALGHDAAG
jgi:acyl-CoA thioester hydrolase